MTILKDSNIKSKNKTCLLDFTCLAALKAADAVAPTALFH
jgi:hypothetical protein